MAWSRIATPPLLLTFKMTLPPKALSTVSVKYAKPVVYPNPIEFEVTALTCCRLMVAPLMDWFRIAVFPKVPEMINVPVGALPMVVAPV